MSRQTPPSLPVRHGTALSSHGRRVRGVKGLGGRDDDGGVVAAAAVVMLAAVVMITQNPSPPVPHSTPPRLSAMRKRFSLMRRTYLLHTTWEEKLGFPLLPAIKSLFFLSHIKDPISGKHRALPH